MYQYLEAWKSQSLYEYTDIPGLHHDEYESSRHDSKVSGEYQGPSAETFHDPPETTTSMSETASLLPVLTT